MAVTRIVGLMYIGGIMMDKTISTFYKDKVEDIIHIQQSRYSKIIIKNNFYRPDQAHTATSTGAWKCFLCKYYSMNITGHLIKPQIQGCLIIDSGIHPGRYSLKMCSLKFTCYIYPCPMNVSTTMPATLLNY